MKLYINPNREEWPAIVSRRISSDEAVESRVVEILDKVRTGGDAALRELAQAIDGYTPESFVVSDE